MGVERLALAKYGLKDVRDLYSKDAEFLASFRFEV
jgi:phenylalanyl-tRNA synthetase alpha chain